MGDNNNDNNDFQRFIDDNGDIVEIRRERLANGIIKTTTIKRDPNGNVISQSLNINQDNSNININTNNESIHVNYGDINIQPDNNNHVILLNIGSNNRRNRNRNIYNNRWNGNRMDDASMNNMRNINNIGNEINNMVRNMMNNLNNNLNNIYNNLANNAVY